MYLYKAVPKQFLLEGKGLFGDSWKGVQAVGLDPSRAGCQGGATQSSAATRKATVLDKDYTWLSMYIEQARSYATGVLANKYPVILRITIPDTWTEKGLVTDHGSSGIGTAQLIPPEWIEFESAKPGLFLPISAYNGKNARITKSDSESESDSDS
jgi:hypothetical protein